MIVIPDSIEPLTGYKWLQLHDGGLTSNYDHAPWPVRQAMEAACIRDWGHEWQPRAWHERRKLIKLPDEVQAYGGSFGSSVVQSSTRRLSRYGIGEAVFYGTPPKKPKLKLPPSLKWSLEDKQPPHQAPDPECTCGIYSLAKRGTHLDRHRASYRGVLVEIAVWGTVIPAETGTRAQYAYPTKILDFITPLTLDEVQTVGDLYGIPLEMGVKTQTPKKLPSHANEMETIAKAHKPAQWTKKKRKHLW